MKKLFTMLTVVAISATMSFAQSGTFALGVGSDMAGTSWQDYSIDPTVGYFISDVMLIGTGFNMSSGDASTETTEISPFVRYYLNSSLYAMGGLSMVTVGEADAVTDIKAGLGLSLMWNDKVAIEPAFGALIGDENLELGLSIGISIRLGMDE